MSQNTLAETDLLLHENRFLKQTILSLRSELVKKEQESEDLVQSKEKELQSEASVYKSTIEELRSEIEQKSAIHEDEKQQIVQNFRNDHKQFQKLILDLRTS